MKLYEVHMLGELFGSDGTEYKLTESICHINANCPEDAEDLAFINYPEYMEFNAVQLQ